MVIAIGTTCRDHSISENLHTPKRLKRFLRFRVGKRIHCSKLLFTCLNQTRPIPVV